MRMLRTLPSEWSWPTRSLPKNRMLDVFDDFDQIVESFLRPAYNRNVNFQSSYDVNESENHYLVSFDMPGVKKDDIRIEVEGNQLMVCGERHREVDQHDGEKGNLRQERMYGRYEKSFTLPTSIDTDKIEAHYENGVLHVAIPKTEQAKARRIEIQSGQEGFFNRLLGSKKESKGKEAKDIRVS